MHLRPNLGIRNLGITLISGPSQNHMQFENYSRNYTPLLRESYITKNYNVTFKGVGALTPILLEHQVSIS